MVLAEEEKEEFIQTAKYSNPISVRKIKTTKIDYLRTEKTTATHRFAPEVLLTVKNDKSEESKDAQMAGRAVTCYECSLG